MEPNSPFSANTPKNVPHPKEEQNFSSSPPKEDPWTPSEETLESLFGGSKIARKENLQKLRGQQVIPYTTEELEDLLKRIEIKAETKEQQNPKINVKNYREIFKTNNLWLDHFHTIFPTTLYSGQLLESKEILDDSKTFFSISLYKKNLNEIIVQPPFVVRNTELKHVIANIQVSLYKPFLNFPLSYYNSLLETPIQDFVKFANNLYYVKNLSFIINLLTTDAFNSLFDRWHPLNSEIGKLEGDDYPYLKKENNIPYKIAQRSEEVMIRVTVYKVVVKKTDKGLETNREYRNKDNAKDFFDGIVSQEFNEFGDKPYRFEISIGDQNSLFVKEIPVSIKAKNISLLNEQGFIGADVIPASFFTSLAPIISTNLENFSPPPSVHPKKIGTDFENEQNTNSSYLVKKAELFTYFRKFYRSESNFFSILDRVLAPLNMTAEQNKLTLLEVFEKIINHRKEEIKVSLEDKYHLLEKAIANLDKDITLLNQLKSKTPYTEEENLKHQTQISDLSFSINKSIVSIKTQAEALNNLMQEFISIREDLQQIVIICNSLLKTYEGAKEIKKNMIAKIEVIKKDAQKQLGNITHKIDKLGLKITNEKEMVLEVKSSKKTFFDHFQVLFEKIHNYQLLKLKG